MIFLIRWIKVCANIIQTHQCKDTQIFFACDIHNHILQENMDQKHMQYHFLWLYIFPKMRSKKLQYNHFL